MYYTIYKTTNTINGRYYVGAHLTPAPLDPYLGSGKLLLAAIEKYGVGAFTKEVLHIYDSFEEMFDMERRIVDEAFVNDPQTYNLVVGGEGGWYHVNGEVKGTKAAPDPHRFPRKG